MNTESFITEKGSAIRVAATDIALLAVVCVIPAISHLLSFPMYLLDPMRLILMTGLLITGSRKNACAMAIALPLLSFLVSGHPVFPKNLAIMAELLVNVALFSLLSKKLSQGIAMFSSIILSKALYYGIKFVLISAGLLATSLVDTGLWYQIGVAAALGVAFARNK